MLAERGLLSISKDGKMEQNFNDGIQNHGDEASMKRTHNRANTQVAMPHIPIPGFNGLLTKTQERHIKAK